MNLTFGWYRTSTSTSTSTTIEYRTSDGSGGWRIVREVRDRGMASNNQCAAHGISRQTPYTYALYDGDTIVGRYPLLREAKQRAEVLHRKRDQDELDLTQPQTAPEPAPQPQTAPEPAPTQSQSWIGEVKVHRDPQWYRNSLVFSSHEDAELYVKDLYYRWTQCEDWRVTETTAEGLVPNYRWDSTEWRAVPLALDATTTPADVTE